MGVTIRSVTTLNLSALPPATEVPEGVIFGVLAEPPGSPGAANNVISLYRATAGAWVPAAIAPGTVQATDVSALVSAGNTLRIYGGKAGLMGGQGGGVIIDGGQTIGVPQYGTVDIGGQSAADVFVGRKTSFNDPVSAPLKARGRFAMCHQLNPQQLAPGGQLTFGSGSPNPINGFTMIIGGGPSPVVSGAQPLELLPASHDAGTLITLWNVGGSQIVLQYDPATTAFIGGGNLVLNQFDLVQLISWGPNGWMQLSAPINVQ